MEYRQLGGLRVSVLTLGTMTFGGKGKFAQAGATDVEGATRQVAMALDAGVNLVDTADVYSAGVCEEIVGAAIAGRRDDLLLATKLRFPVGRGPNDAGLSRHHVIRACEASLRRMQVEHVDLLQLHEWDGQTPVEETLAALETLVGQGKVRYVGCSNFTAWQMLKALGVADARGLPRFVSTQVYYSLQERTIEHEILPACLDQGVGVLVWSPLAGGLLTGKYRRGQDGPAGARHLTAWNEPPIYDEDKLYDTIEAVVQVAEARGVSGAQVALAWLLGRPGITSLVIGARTDEQLADNLGAADLVLSAEEIAQLERVSRPPLPYPLWHQAMTATDRLGPADRAVLAPYLDD